MSVFLRDSQLVLTGVSSKRTNNLSFMRLPFVGSWAWRGPIPWRPPWAVRARAIRISTLGTTCHRDGAWGGEAQENGRWSEVQGIPIKYVSAPNVTRIANCQFGSSFEFHT